MTGPGTVGALRVGPSARKFPGRGYGGWRQGVGSLDLMATAATRKRARRQERRRTALQAREAWRDENFGIRVLATDLRAEYCRLEWRVDSEPVVALLAAPHVRAMVDALEMHAVRELRRQGESWDDLGVFLDMTAEGARRKFGHVERMLDELDVEKAVEGRAITEKVGDGRAGHVAGVGGPASSSRSRGSVRRSGWMPRLSR